MASLVARLTKAANQTPQHLQRVYTWGLPKLNKFWSIAKVELAPPTPGDIPAMTKGVLRCVNPKNLGNLTTKEVFVNGLVCAEIYVMFYLGEIAGKRSLFGYNIKGAWSYPKVLLKH